MSFVQTFTKIPCTLLAFANNLH